MNIMNSSGDFAVLNFQSLIDKYETIIQDVTQELDAVQVEQSAIRNVLKENTQLGAELTKVLIQKSNCNVDHTYKENSLIENLKEQLKMVINEKEQAIKLWQNAAGAVDHLETELKIYQDNTEGLVPKSKLVQLKESYERKLNDLQNTVALTKAKLEEVINLKSHELKVKDKEILGTLQSQDNNFKIIKNLEEEVLNLQQRLSEVTGDKNRLEKNIKGKNDEIQSLRLKVKECRSKVEEALQVVEAALNEKDAALLRENETKEEIVRLSKSLEEIVKEADVKVKTIKGEHDQKFDKLVTDLKASEEEVKQYWKKCAFLEEEVERLHKGHVYVDEGGTSKLLMLEKNLESTFQKLLLSEKQNIQLKSETENIKQDLDQMAKFYERDITTREAEKAVLRNEIKKLKTELDESNTRAAHSADVINNLNERLSTMEISFGEKIEELKRQRSLERQETEAAHRKMVEELQTQLLSQNEINKRWRTEANNITERLEKRIIELKLALNKVKTENKSLNDCLKETNLKMYEYRKFLQMISQDVSKITSITLPELGVVFNFLTTLSANNVKNH